MNKMTTFYLMVISKILRESYSQPFGSLYSLAG